MTAGLPPDQNGQDAAAQPPARRGPFARAAATAVPPPIGKPPRSPRAALEPEKVPAPRRASARARHPMVVFGNAIFTLLVVIAVALGGGLFVGKQKFDAPGPLGDDKIVNIPSGYGVKDISDLLQREGVIDQPYVFFGGVMVLKARGLTLKHGEYKFVKHASLSDVVETLSEGKVVQHAFTVPEGLTSEQIVQRLLETSALSGQIKEIPREGSLLPETYRFTRGMSRDQIIARMEQAQKRVLAEVWARRSSDLPSQVQTPEQLVTLASIVEKETSRDDERTRVAAVFVNRLKSKMRLQSDPTIIYGLTGGKGALGRPIMKSEIEQATPYNTYTIDGLPPGPIANPGRASLEAAANPARTKELYFVADGTGGHVFSDTYAEHQKNVAKLRALERGATAPAGTVPADVPKPVETPKPEAKPEAAKPAEPAKPKNGARR